MDNREVARKRSSHESRLCSSVYTRIRSSALCVQNAKRRWAFRSSGCNPLDPPTLSCRAPAPPPQPARLQRARRRLAASFRRCHFSRGRGKSWIALTGQINCLQEKLTRTRQLRSFSSENLYEPLPTRRTASHSRPAVRRVSRFSPPPPFLPLSFFVPSFFDFCYFRYGFFFISCPRAVLFRHRQINTGRAR